MRYDTGLLIIGAGPFGLALSAHARSRGIDHIIVGEPMEFWQRHMPAGMLLRSACDWHLDVDGVHTIDAWLAAQNLTCDDVLPLSLPRYLAYVQWFQEKSGIHVMRGRVQRLDHGGDGYAAALEDGSVIHAQRVVVAIGFGLFKHLPDDVVPLLPENTFTHASDVSDFALMRNRRILVIGGRMAAFESSALLAETGAAAVHISYRHDTPAFTLSHWDWIVGLLDRMTSEPGWYRQRSQAEKDAIQSGMFREGRLQLEPWLGPRVQREEITLWPRTRVTAAERLPDGSIHVKFDNGEGIDVDHIILATGYQADIARVPFIRDGTVWPRLDVQDGFPVLDTGFQSSLPGLYFTSILASRDFGPFFGFTVSARFSAQQITDRLARIRLQP